MDQQEEHVSRLLRLIYEVSGGNTEEIVRRKHLGRPIGLSDQETKAALKRLTREGSIRPILFGCLCITHAGIAAARRLGAPGEAGGQARLREVLSSRLGEGELRSLCLDLGVDYEDLPGEGKADKARELVVYVTRRDRVPKLLQAGARMRPDIPWFDLEEP